tara:strand:+ start:171 stop:509 length:339 start_codon:yes stop_codon:yes gene_type:complete
MVSTDYFYIPTYQTADNKAEQIKAFVNAVTSDQYSFTRLWSDIPGVGTQIVTVYGIDADGEKIRLAHLPHHQAKTILDLLDLPRPYIGLSSVRSHDQDGPLEYEPTTDVNRY